jgi:tetratricopeptide (TPR) repeat protein
MAEFQAIFEKQDFTSLDDARIFMEEAAGKSLDVFDEAENDDPCYLAQQLAYDAMEAPSDREASRLAREALKIDPDCVDALVIVAELTRSPTKRLFLFEEAVKVGEKRLGEDFFAENEGHFWDILETRPYMRAKKGLADELIHARRPLDAMRHLEELLKLCPNDNMGNRFDLLGTYLISDHLDQALELLNRYPEGFSAIWNWSAVLIHYLRRDFDAATEWLARARKQNRYVEPYLSGKKKIPDVQPEFYTVGKESEAIVCASHLAAPWALHPVALAWLIFGGRPGDGRYCGILTDAKR